jgi:hypothetical protein
MKRRAFRNANAKRDTTAPFHLANLVDLNACNVLPILFRLKAHPPYWNVDAMQGFMGRT